MTRKRHTAEQVVNLLRQVEVAIANGKTTVLACKEALITEQTYYRWRKEYGGLQVDQAKRLKELEQENSKLLCNYAGRGLAVCSLTPSFAPREATSMPG
jgi:putative transposase